jgi:peptidoglycan/xylan/chitin deacetylase (PgdA/CDA1 family)
MSRFLRGAVTFVFDDGYTSVYTNVLPLLARHKFPAVFAVALEHRAVEQTEQRSVTPAADWLTIREQGHEIAAHSVSHRNLTRLSPSELSRELMEPAEQLAATTLVYPGGAVDETVRQEAGKHYRAARTVKKGFEKIIPADPLALKTYNFTRHNFSVWRANALAFWACLTGRWLIETYHLIDDNEAEKEHAVNQRDFAAHLNFLSKLPIAVVTIQSMMTRTKVKKA